MATLYGRQFTRAELLRYVGSVRQIAGVSVKTVADGAGRGVRVADVRTGSGFCFSVLIDRGMDIGAASWCGRPLAWDSGTGAVHPALYDPRGDGWLRSFGGGLMTGCGLGNVGSACSDAGEDLGVHGRLSNSPAELTGCDGAWRGDEYEMWVEGRVRHFKMFSANLVLQRRISTRLGSNALRLEDTITNLGFEPTPFQILYHCNFGYPVVSPDTVLRLDAEQSAPRDAQAAQGFARYDRCEAPTAGYAEQVFYHHPRPDGAGYATAALINQATSFGAYIRFRTAELPHLVQWKMMGQGTYVVGLEPANCWVQGRAHDRAQDVLRTLAAGETMSTDLEIGVLPDREAIEARPFGDRAPL